MVGRRGGVDRRSMLRSRDRKTRLKLAEKGRWKESVCAGLEERSRGRRRTAIKRGLA